MITPSLSLEHELIAQGFQVIVAVDEVGRGAIAGPVSVGAGIWRPQLGEGPASVRDSKLVPERKRPQLANLAEDWLEAVSVGHCDAQTIDRDGIQTALAIAGASAVGSLIEGLGHTDGVVVVLDGRHNWLSTKIPQEIPVVTREKADRDCQSVAGVSLVAKVARDALMIQADSRWPEYGFAGHKGYASKAHLAAIAQRGPCEIHRLTWLRPTELSFEGE